MESPEGAAPSRRPDYAAAQLFPHETSPVGSSDSVYAHSSESLRAVDGGGVCSADGTAAASNAVPDGVKKKRRRRKLTCSFTNGASCWDPNANAFKNCCCNPRKEDLVQCPNPECRRAFCIQHLREFAELASAKLGAERLEAKGIANTVLEDLLALGPEDAFRFRTKCIMCCNFSLFAPPPPTLPGDYLEARPRIVLEGAFVEEIDAVMDDDSERSRVVLILVLTAFSVLPYFATRVAQHLKFREYSAAHGAHYAPISPYFTLEEIEQASWLRRSGGPTIEEATARCIARFGRVPDDRVVLARSSKGRALSVMGYHPSPCFAVSDVLRNERDADCVIDVMSDARYKSQTTKQGVSARHGSARGAVRHSSALRTGGSNPFWHGSYGDLRDCMLDPSLLQAPPRKVALVIPAGKPGREGVSDVIVCYASNRKKRSACFRYATPDVGHQAKGDYVVMRASEMASKQGESRPGAHTPLRLICRSISVRVNMARLLLQLGADRPELKTSSHSTTKTDEIFRASRDYEVALGSRSDDFSKGSGGLCLLRTARK